MIVDNMVTTTAPSTRRQRAVDSTAIVNGWQRPSQRFCESGHCAEVKHADGHMFIRASLMAPDVVTLTTAEFTAFVSAVKAGEYDHMIDSL